MSGRCVCSSVHTHTLKQQLLRLNIHVFTKISVEILWEHFQPKGLTWTTSSRPNTTTDSHHVCSLGLSVVQNNSSVFFIPSSTYGKRAGSEFRIDLIPRLHSLFSALFWHKQTCGLNRELVKSNREPSWTGTIQDPMLENQEKKTSRHRRRTCKIYWESRHRTRDLL